MLIKALCEYYDVLAKDGKVLPEGYSCIDVSYLICLTAEGKVENIIDWREIITDQKGIIKSIPKQIQVPLRASKSAIYPEIIEHRARYIFGLKYEKGCFVSESNKQDPQKSHEVFVKANLEFVDGIDSPIVNAYRNFMRKWVPQDETKNELIGSVFGKNIESAHCAFCLSGHPEILLHEDLFINKRWHDRISLKNEDTVIAQCSITGKISEIVPTHFKIKNICEKDGTLICFNNASDQSYNRKQSFNSNVSKQAMVKYTEALNYLLADRKHRTNIGELTVVHWAASGNERCSDLFNFSFSDEPEIDDESLKELMKNVAEGRLRFDELSLLELGIDDDTDYYIVGMKPNSSRIAVKFIYRRKFGEIVRNIAVHQNDLRFSENDKTVSFRTLLGVLPAPNENNAPIDPSLADKLLEAAVNGYRYPNQLLYRCMRRIVLDAGDKYVKHNDIRKRIIKATINRNARLSGKKEEITMSLDRNNDSPSYLCGRLFAELEDIQQRSANTRLKRTIRDSYFAATAAHPSALFPRILKLAQYHLSKLGNPKYAEEQLAEIMDKLGNGFPQSLNTTEQGKFMIGYYHQKSYLDELKKAKTENKKTINEGEVK